jgi:hypothetical protein
MWYSVSFFCCDSVYIVKGYITSALSHNFQNDRPSNGRSGEREALDSKVLSTLSVTSY